MKKRNLKIMDKFHLKLDVVNKLKPFGYVRMVKDCRLFGFNEPYRFVKLNQQLTGKNKNTLSQIHNIKEDNR